MTWLEVPEAMAPLELQDVVAALPVWAGVADGGDHLGLALDLFAACGQHEPSERHTVQRARLLLLAGRRREALAQLHAEQITELPQGGLVSWVDAVLAACLAADGDRSAYRALLQTAATATGVTGLQMAYLVAAAADQLADYAIADQAWRRLAIDYGVRTRLTVRM